MHVWEDRERVYDENSSERWRVCLGKKERERERETDTGRVCVCVCVCESQSIERECMS